MFSRLSNGKYRITTQVIHTEREHCTSLNKSPVEQTIYADRATRPTIVKQIEIKGSNVRSDKLFNGAFTLLVTTSNPLLIYGVLYQFQLQGYGHHFPSGRAYLSGYGVCPFHYTNASSMSQKLKKLRSLGNTPELKPQVELALKHID